MSLAGTMNDRIKRPCRHVRRNRSKVTANIVRGRPAERGNLGAGISPGTGNVTAEKSACSGDQYLSRHKSTEFLKRILQETGSSPTSVIYGMYRNLLARSPP